MRARNALTRLAAVAPTAEPLLDDGDEDRILAQILASPRRAGRRRPLTLVLVGAAIVGAAAVAVSLDRGNSHSSASGTPNNHVALTGTRIQMAGYRFRTPAGFTASTVSCPGPASIPGKPGTPETVGEGFRAAASADGGCLEAFYVISATGSAVPADASPIDVGAYHGYLVAPDSSQVTTLYVVLPGSGGSIDWQALMLQSQGLTTAQLIAVAESGLPASP